MAELDIAFRLPIDGWPRAVFETNYSFRGGRLMLGGEAVVEAGTRDELERGLRGALPTGEAVELALAGSHAHGAAGVRVRVGDRAALREDALRRAPSRSAWVHAIIALTASFAGFIASYMYLHKASVVDSAWSYKMGIHMAAWHLLLTFTLFPVSVWCQRIGIRAVQFVSLLFFCIHVGIAAANMGMEDIGIFAFNGLSGVLFLTATFYGNIAHRDMDPVSALAGAPAPR